MIGSGVMWMPPWRSRALGELIHEGREKPLMVWRIENEKGIGPYQSVPRDQIIFADDPRSPEKKVTERALFKFVIAGDRHGDKPDPISTRIGRDSAKTIVKDALNPHPSDDFEKREWTALPERTQKQYKFGFPTERSIVDWFGTKRLREFESQGFKTKQVPARRVVLSKSGRQVLYVPWEAQYRAPPKDYYQKWRAESEESLRRMEAYRKRKDAKRRLRR